MDYYCDSDDSTGLGLDYYDTARFLHKENQDRKQGGERVATPTKVDGLEDIDCAAWHSVALDRQGKMLIWGCQL